MNTFTPCGKCCNGYILNHGTFTTQKCECLKRFQRQAKLEDLLDKANIPTQLSSQPTAVTLLDYQFDTDYVGEDSRGNLAKIKKFVKYFDSKYSSLNMYWYSLNGMQKTTLSKVICRDLLKKGKTVYYILADDLIKRLIDSERDDELKAECKTIMNTDFLVIDELDESKITKFKSGFQVPFLTSFLKTRIESLRKSTLFCSNREIDNMGSFFGEALQDLVLREVLDKTMIFEDNYASKSKAFDPSTLWD